jgi:hypothetical protein
MKTRNKRERQGRDLHPPYQALISTTRRKTHAVARVSKHKARL